MYVFSRETFWKMCSHRVLKMWRITDVFPVKTISWVMTTQEQVGFSGFSAFLASGGPRQGLRLEWAAAGCMFITGSLSHC